MHAKTSDLPLAAYVRVSRIGARDEDRLRSPEFQRQTIEGYAKGAGLELEHFEPELDVSGSKAKRPILDGILEQIREGTLGGIVVAKLDRLSRMSPKDRLELFETVEEAGGIILSASEQLDPSSPEGRFQRELFLSLARMQWEQYRDAWDRAKAGAHARGMKIGPTPLGYVRLEDGTLELHEVEAPIVRHAFELCGESGIHAAMEYLQACDLRHANGKRAGQARAWRRNTVRRLFANRTYLGEARYGNLEPVQVPVIVSRGVWEAAQTEPEFRRRKARAFPLSGIATCGHCGEAMVGHSGGTKNQRGYRCRASAPAWKGDTCPINTIVAERLEQYVRDELAAASTAGWTRAKGDADLEAAEQAMMEAESEEESLLADHKLRATLGAERFQRLAERTIAAADAAREAYRSLAAEVAREVVYLPAPEFIRDCTGDELRALALGALTRLEVTRGRRPVGERVLVVADPVPPVASA